MEFTKLKEKIGALSYKLESYRDYGTRNIYYEETLKEKKELQDKLPRVIKQRRYLEHELEKLEGSSYHAPPNLHYPDEIAGKRTTAPPSRYTVPKPTPKPRRPPSPPRIIK
eukprot:sb/3477210/